MLCLRDILGYSYLLSKYRLLEKVCLATLLFMVGRKPAKIERFCLHMVLKLPSFSSNFNFYLSVVFNLDPLVVGGKRDSRW
jgi:hypothetical protein